MKILQINSVNGLRSTGRTTLELADSLGNNGHASYVAYSKGLSFSNGYKIGNWFDRKVHAFLSRLLGKQAYYSKISTKRLIKFITRIKPDIIHLRNMHANYINLRMLLNYIAQNDIPTVLTLHDCWFFTGKCTFYSEENCLRWQNRCGHCPRLKKDNKSWFFDFTKQMKDEKEALYNRIPRLGVVGVSNWITKEAKKSILSSATSIKRIYNWIDLEVFFPRHSNRLKNRLKLHKKFIVLGVATKWTKAKGIERFLDLAQILPPDCIIILVGNIMNDYVLPKNIINIPETNDTEELSYYYSLADVFVNLSLVESFGKVTIESLACGTPAIVINSTANPELIGENCGYVLDDYTSENILKYILKVQRNTKDFYTDYCVEYARKFFDKRILVREYIKFYESLLK